VLVTPATTPEPRRVFRFAPSPNGYVHRGHAYSALLNQHAAEATGGRMLLRIEDIDMARARPEFEAAIYEDLAWLGLRWEEPVLRQRERFEVYGEALAALDRLGLLYPAFLTRGEIRARVTEAEASGEEWPRDPDGGSHYPGDERDWPEARSKAVIESGKPYALRLDMGRALAEVRPLGWREADPLGAVPPHAQAADPAAWGDVVLARKELPASYHIAVVVDDAYQGVTDIVRGLDLKPSTSVHRLLQTLLGLPEPRYFHHALILDETDAKLSKSRGSETIRAWREAGESAETLIGGLPGYS
jgi:glutamyl-Q tRNA(Asp) synthetase